MVRLRLSPLDPPIIFFFWLDLALLTAVLDPASCLLFVGRKKLFGGKGFFPSFWMFFLYWAAVPGVAVEGPRGNFLRPRSSAKFPLQRIRLYGFSQLGEFYLSIQTDFL